MAIKRSATVLIGQQKAPTAVRIEMPQVLRRSYQRRALASPNEVLGLLVGTTLKENDKLVEIRITDIIYPPVQSTADEVVWNPQHIIRLQVQVLPFQILGTIHSHPNCEPGLSKEDLVSAREYEETISGVFSYWVPKGGVRRKSSLDFYCGNQPVEVV